jgi:hypothetical protein
MYPMLSIIFTVTFTGYLQSCGPHPMGKFPSSIIKETVGTIDTYHGSHGSEMPVEYWTFFRTKALLSTIHGWWTGSR